MGYSSFLHDNTSFWNFPGLSRLPELESIPLFDSYILSPLASTEHLTPRSACEEVAARILAVCRAADKWCGIPAEYLVATALKDVARCHPTSSDDSSVSELCTLVYTHPVERVIEMGIEELSARDLVSYYYPPEAKQLVLIPRPELAHFLMNKRSFIKQPPTQPRHLAETA